MIRIPDPGRFELRLMDGSANPYLLQASVLAAGLYGLENKVDPGKPLDCNMYEDHAKYPDLPKLPDELTQSLNLLQNSKEMNDAFGKETINSYIKLRKSEINEFDNKDKLGLSKMAYNFLGGVIKNASSLSAFFNPTINSYRRINAPPTKSGASWSPSSISYTGNNRTHMIRIPDPGRFELRLMDGSANPYLLQAVSYTHLTLPTTLQV